MPDLFIDVTGEDGSKQRVAPEHLGEAVKAGFKVDAADTDGLIPIANGDDRQRVSPENFRAAVDAGFRLDMPELEPQPEPEAPQVGQLVSADQLPERPAEDPGMESRRTALDKARTYFEGNAQGAAAGFRTPIEYAEGASTWLGNKLFEATHKDAREADFAESLKDARKGIQERADANPGWNTAGQVAGVVLPALATGGSSALLRGASMYTPAGALSRVAGGAGNIVNNLTAAKLPGAITAGAIEGASYGAAQHEREVVDAINTGDWEGVTDKVLAGAAFGGLFGGALPIATWSVGKVAGATAEKARKLKLVSDDWLDNFAANRAYKAALGQRNKGAINKADRYLGGTADVGRTLIREGVVTKTSTIADVAEKAAQLTDERGKLIGELVDQFDSTGMTASRAELMKRLNTEVFDKLARTPTGRAIANSIRSKPAIANELEDLATGQSGVPLRELWERRKAMADALGAWQKAPGDETLTGVRQIIGIYNNYFDDLAEGAAKSLGKPELSKAYELARREYSHLIHARDIANDAIKGDLNRRFISLSDYLTGVAMFGGSSVASGDLSPENIAYGLLAAAAHKTLRTGTNAVVAQLGKRAASKLPRSVDVLNGASDDLLKAAGEAQNRLNIASKLKGLMSGAKGLASGAIEAVKPQVGNVVTYQAVQKMLAAYHPESEESQQFSADLANLAFESPEMAEYAASKRELAAQFLASKAGPQPLDQFGRPTPHDPQAQKQLERYATALNDPMSAIERISSGNGTDEDAETLQQVYPRLYNEFISKALAEIDDKTPYKKRIRISQALGVPVDDTLDPEFIAAMQDSAQLGLADQETQKQKGAPNMGQGLNTRSDRISAR